MAAVDLTAPEQVLYSYKLDGADEDWNHLGNQNTISIPPMRPGRYTLRIRSTNGAGLEVDNERVFNIMVRRQFLQTGWAGLVYLLLASLSAFILTRRLNRRGEEKPEAAENPLLHGLHGDDRRFVESFTGFLSSRLDDGALDVPQMCAAMNVSRSVLFERCRTLLGTTPASFLRRMRLQRAQELIREGGRTMTEVSYAVGFNDPHYFSKIFKKEFGVKPTDYRRTTTT